MFDFGFSEMMIIGVIALVVLGPERLPTVARTAGEWVGKAQRFVAQVKSDIDRESSLSELKKIQEEAKALAEDVKSTVEKTASEMERDVNAVAKQVQTAGTEIEKSVSDTAAEASSGLGSETSASAASADDISSVYGWGAASDPEPAVSPSYSWSAPKTFEKRYHCGPSVDQLAAEIERLRRELGLRETSMGTVSGSARKLSPRARSSRARIYR